MAETTEAAATAVDPSAPPAERYDANLALTKAYAPRALADLIPAAEVQPVIDYINQSWEDAQMAKAISDNVVPFPPKSRGKAGMQSVYLDEYLLVAQGSYWDRPGLLGFDAMRAMVEQTPLLNSIIITRIRQAMRFCRVQANGVGPGFAISHVDKTVEMDDQQQRSVQLLQAFMSNCGWEFDPRKRKRLRRDTFAQFMAKSVRDSLTLDSAAIETEFKRDVNLGIDGFYAVDGATIRLCTEDGYHGDDEIFALQVVEGRIRTAYTFDDLIYEPRNPRSDVKSCGYGLAETEMLVRVVTYLLNTMRYNGSYFDKNSVPRGVMHLIGNYSAEDLSAFKRYWNAMVRGVENTWNVPVLTAKDPESKAEFVELNAQLSEMAFAKWMTFLTSLACAVYGIAPEEISMGSFSDGKSALSGDDTEERMGAGTNNGMRPLMTYYENLISDFIIRPFSDQYCFRFTGLDDDDPKQRFEMRKLITTLNEARVQEGYDPIEGPLGDAPLNPSLLSAWQAMQQQQQQPQGDFGNPQDQQGGEEQQGAGGEEQGGDNQAADFGQGQQQQQQRQTPEGAPDFGGRPRGGDFGAAKGDGDMGKAFGLPVYRLEL